MADRQSCPHSVTVLFDSPVSGWMGLSAVRRIVWHLAGVRYLPDARSRHAVKTRATDSRLCGIQQTRLEGRGIEQSGTWRQQPPQVVGHRTPFGLIDFHCLHNITCDLLEPPRESCASANSLTQSCQNWCAERSIPPIFLSVRAQGRPRFHRRLPAPSCRS